MWRISIITLFGLVALSSAQLELTELNDNRCLKLLKPTISQSTYSSTIGHCVNSLRLVPDTYDDKVKRELVARCIAVKLNFLNQDNTINKDHLRSVINGQQTLTEKQRNSFLAAVDRCNDFSKCLSQECNII